MSRRRVEQVIPLAADHEVQPIAERDGIAWLTARPELLGWPHDIVWLFAPVNRTRPWPGDLVGLDGVGNLVLVEAKYVGRSRDRCDPFETFVSPDLYAVAAEWQPAREPAALRAEWEARLADEAERRRVFGTARFSDGAMPGVLPYGNHRKMWRDWNALYAEVDAYLFDSAQEWSFGYRDKVKHYLAVRERSPNAGVVYGGFVAVTSDDPPSRLREGAPGQPIHASDVLTTEGVGHLDALRKEARAGFTLLRVVRGQRQGDSMRLVSLCVELD